MIRKSLVFVAVLAALAPVAGRAQVVPDAVPDLTLLGQQVARGTGLITQFTGNVPPTPKVVDGDIADWTGAISRYAGTAIYSHGEYVYQDYVGDNFGADDGEDAGRAETTDELANTEPRTYRIEALSQAAGEQFGIEGCPRNVCSDAAYGDSRDGSARVNTDIEEVRIAADAANWYVLVRTAGMLDDTTTGVVVIVGKTGEDLNPAPGGIVSTSKVWLLASGDSVKQTSNIDASNVRVATNSSGYTNAIEIAFPRDADSQSRSFRVATCAMDGNACKSVKKGDAKSDLMNVAFRPNEPARIWMEHDQAFALRNGNIDSFAQVVKATRLEAGYTESFQPGPGYWERVYVTDSEVNNEAQNSGSYFQGAFQHYGVYLPTNFRGGSDAIYPTTWWTHYRGGHAHDAAAWVPGLLRQFGEQKGNIMITPSARGTSSWYVGRGMEDFLDVWDDATKNLPIDPDRVYMTGYSMGGFASWLLPTLMPDRFAGASPQEGPATQGLLVAGTSATGAIVTQPQNGGDVEAENTYNLLENARNLAYAIYNGNTDELVWITGIASMHAKLTQLGYNNRLYQIDGGEHYASAILDQWQEAANYLNEFRRDPNPPHVTYRTWPAIEHAVSTISTNNQNLKYRFNKAYWVSGLEVRTVRTLSNGKPDPRDWGTIDATTTGRGMDTFTGVPEAGVGMQGTPYRMTGWRNVKTGHVAPSNTFSVTLTNLSDATLDVERMGIASSKPISATLTTDGPATITLAGGWSRVLNVACPGTSICAYDHSAAYTGSALKIVLPAAGTYTFTTLPQ